MAAGPSGRLRHRDGGWTDPASPRSRRPCKHFALVSPRRLSPIRLRSPVLSPRTPRAASPQRAVSPIVRAFSPALRAGVNAIATAGSLDGFPGVLHVHESAVSKANRKAEEVRRDKEERVSIIAMMVECKRRATQHMASTGASVTCSYFKPAFSFRAAFASCCFCLALLSR